MIACGLSAATFSLSLGAASVALPLLAVRSGYSLAEVGMLTAISGGAQIVARLGLGAAMRRWPDRTIIAFGAVALSASCGMVVVSAAWASFVIVELLQGVARACFFTGSQAHVVRGEGTAMGPLAAVNFVAAVGSLAGPIGAGVLSEASPSLALALAGLVGLAAVPPILALDRLPPFELPPEQIPGRIWMRPGVDAGCCASLTSGAWRGLLGSYVPVALEAGRQSTSRIGLLVAISTAAWATGSVLVARVGAASVTTWFVVSTVATGVGMAAVTALARNFPGAAAALVASGLGAGALSTIGPAIASDAVHYEERGNVIAVTGMFRAGALMAAPLFVAAIVGVVALAPAMAATGVVLALPVLVVRHTARQAEE